MIGWFVNCNAAIVTTDTGAGDCRVIKSYSFPVRVGMAIRTRFFNQEMFGGLTFTPLVIVTAFT